MTMEQHVYRRIMAIQSNNSSTFYMVHSWYCVTTTTGIDDISAPLGMNSAIFASVSIHLVVVLTSSVYYSCVTTHAHESRSKLKATPPVRVGWSGYRSQVVRI